HDIRFYSRNYSPEFCVPTETDHCSASAFIPPTKDVIILAIIHQNSVCRLRPTIVLPLPLFHPLKTLSFSQLSTRLLCADCAPPLFCVCLSSTHYRRYHSRNCSPPFCLPTESAHRTASSA